MTHKLEIDGIHLQFGHRVILSDIYLTCETGNIIGLMGRNGQGKSCLMKIIYGTMKSDKSVRIDGMAQYQTFKRPARLLYLPQFNFVPASLSLQRIFWDYDLSFSSFSEAFPEFASSYMTPIGRLSGGLRRLIEVYVIVKSNSSFALLDEPFSHLSPLQIEKVQKLLLQEKVNKGLFITDHMYRHVLDICDNLYVLSNGKTHLTKNPEDIEILGYAKL